MQFERIVLKPNFANMYSIMSSNNVNDWQWRAIVLSSSSLVIITIFQ